jgi:hypothetical protein
MKQFRFDGVCVDCFTTGVLVMFRSVAWSTPWYEEDVIAARLCALNTLQLLTAVCDEQGYARHDRTGILSR